MFFQIFLQPVMRKFIGCKNVAHHKNIFLSLSVLSWAHSSPCPLGLCGIAKKISSKYNVTWDSWKRRSLWPTRSILTHLSMSPRSIDNSTKAAKVFNQCPSDGWKLRPLVTCEVLENYTNVCETDVNHILRVWVRTLYALT